MYSPAFDIRQKQQPTTNNKMKAYIHIFVDDYEVTINTLKPADVKSILAALCEFLQKESVVFEIKLTHFIDPVALGVPAPFLHTFNMKKIELNPFGFHKNLKIMFEHVSNTNSVCMCGDIYCEGHCGTLHCGCIDICRGYCGQGYDSY